MLAHLGGRTSVAPTVVSSRRGTVITACFGEPFVVSSYVPGEVAGLEERNLAAVGAVLGQLHAEESRIAPMALPKRLSDGMDPPRIREAQMLPSNELPDPEALRELHRSHTDGDMGGELDVLALACADVRGLCARPLMRTLLHGDCHPWNAVVRADGTATLVDWESAGPGPAVIDLGFLLLSAAMGAIDAAPTELHRGRVKAVATGYAEHRRLSDEELEALPAAILFRSLVFEVATVCKALETGMEPEAQWWSHRRLAVDRIATIARPLLA